MKSNKHEFMCTQHGSADKPAVLQWVANETGYTLGTADARLLPMHHGDSFVVVADVTSVRHWPGEIWRRVEADIVNAAVVMRNRVTSCKRTKR